MTTYKAKKTISRMLKYYVTNEELLKEEYIQGKNDGMELAVNLFLTEFKGRKREILELYVIRLFQSKEGRTN